MTALLVLALLGDETTYAEISRKHGLADADKLMREGKYLEAAVAYRNVLLKAGDHEAVRLPLALALFAHGDFTYAGTELRRAQTFYPGFAATRIELGDLFASRPAVALQADRVAREKIDGEAAEGHAALGYLFHLLGDHDRAAAAVKRYADARGQDALARDLLGMIERARQKATPPPRPPADLERLEKRVCQMGGKTSAGRAGAPIRAETRYHETSARARGEVFEK